ncbi:MAG: DUF2141 domain-containing protein [Flavobacteriales bacterium]
MKRRHAYQILAGICLLFLAACAQVRSVSGGEKDVDPPQVIASPHLKTGWTASSFDIEFDEYVQVSNPKQQLLVSPPLAQVQVKTTPKGIRVSWQDTLRTNTTYVFNFGECISDVHEGNILSEYVCAFSTGSALDSCAIHGLVKIAERDSAAGNIRIFIHDTDSSYRKKGSKPLYSGRSNTTGEFSIPYLKPGTYFMSALSDDNNNARWDDGELMSLPQEIELPDTNSHVLHLSRPINAKNTGISYRILGGQYYAAYVPRTRVLVSSTTDIGQTLPAYRNEDSVYWDIRGMEGSAWYAEYEGGLRDTIELQRKPSEIFPIIPHTPKRIGPSDTLFLLSPLPLDSVHASGFSIRCDSLTVPFSVQLRDQHQMLVTGNWIPGKKHLVTGSSGFLQSASSSSDSLNFAFEILNEKTSGGVQLMLDSCLAGMGAQRVLQVVSKTGGLVKALRLEERMSITLPCLEIGEYRMFLLFDEDGNGVFTPCDPFLQHQAERVIALESSIQVRPNWMTSIRWGCR